MNYLNQNQIYKFLHLLKYYDHVRITLPIPTETRSDTYRAQPLLNRTKFSAKKKKKKKIFPI